MHTLTSTPRSSITAAADHHFLPSSNFSLDAEVARDEARFEEYGGDDPLEPSALAKQFSSSQSPTATIVQDSTVTWDGPDDPTNPQNWSSSYKWMIVAVAAVMTVNVTFASSAPTAVTGEIVEAFNISAELSYLMTSLFILGYVVGSLFWGPGSELFGRRPVVLLALSAYTLLHLGQALAKNIETLLITRFLAGVFAVAPLTICGGIIADIMSAVGRGYASSLFASSVFLGPVLGPVVGSLIATSSLSWPWVFWVMMIFAGVCTAITAVLLPETYAPVLLHRKAQRLRGVDPIANKDLKAEHESQDWSLKGVLHRTLYRPFKMLGMEPILVLITIYLSIVYGVLYALFEAFPIIFIERHGFTMAQNGLVFIGVGVGTTLGALINFAFAARYPSLTEKWKGFPPPEERLYGAMIGGPGLVIGSFWLGWTGEYSSIPWYVPGISTVVLGTSISLIFMSFISYLIDTYLMFSASAIAANSILRSAVGAAFPLFTVQMYNKLGINWASTVVGLIALLFAPSPFLFYIFGPRIRSKSKFAPCIDLKIAEELKAEEAEQEKSYPRVQ